MIIASGLGLMLGIFIAWGFGPLISSLVFGRPMTPADRDLVGWSAAGLVLGVVIFVMLALASRG